MAFELGSGEVISATLLVKAVLAILAVLLAIYYKLHWDRAKHHLQIHFFFTKWRMVQHAVILGLAAVGFAAGFTIEFLGVNMGMGPNTARFASNIFEIGSLFCMLFVFFNLALEDVPHFQHVSEAAKRHRANHGNEMAHEEFSAEQPAKRKAKTARKQPARKSAKKKRK